MIYNTKYLARNKIIHTRDTVKSGSQPCDARNNGIGRSTLGF